MKRRKLKKYVKIIMFIVVLGISALIIPLVNNNTESVSKEKDDFTYVNDYLFDNYYPVINSEEKILRPYADEKVKIYKSFYEKEASEEEQKESIIYHENIYMQNSGITYNSDNQFDVLASITGTVTDVSEDALLGKTVEIRNSNEIITIYQSLSEVSVKKGDSVTSGQRIAKSGTNTLEPNVKNGLHFEIYNNGTVINPEKTYNKKINEFENKN